MLVSQWLVYTIYMSFLVINVTWAAKGGNSPSNMTRGQPDLGEKSPVVDTPEYSISNVTESNSTGLNVVEYFIQLMAPSVTNATIVPANGTNVSEQNQDSETTTQTTLNPVSTKNSRTATFPSFVDYYDPYNKYPNYIRRSRKRNNRLGSRNRLHNRQGSQQGRNSIYDIPQDILDCCVPDEQRLMANLLAHYEPASRPVFNASHIVTVSFGLTLTQISDMGGVMGNRRAARRLRVPDEQRLMRKILSNYDTAARPVFNASHSVTVKYGLTLIQIADMDEVNQVLTTNVWLEQEWKDERLKWDPAEYSGLHTMRIPCDRIWLPDIVLYNSADDFTEGFMQSKAMVNSDGNVFWPPPAKLRSSCKIDITYFPFDDQKCKMKFGSWTYDGFQVDVTNRSARVDLANYVYSGEWELIEIRVQRNEVYYACCKEPYPDVTFFIIMRRRTLYYLFNIIFPCLWLTILSLLGFWLPPDSGEKITLGITVLLAFSVFMLLIAESMPATSEFVPLIGIYLTVTMAMTSLSIVLTVFVLQLHHVGPNTKPVPRWIRIIVITVISRLICMRSSNTNYYQYDKKQREQLTRSGSLQRSGSFRSSIRERQRVQGRMASGGGPTSANRRQDEICLTSFIDNLDMLKDTNCNGRPPEYNNIDPSRNVTYDKISKHLKILISKHDSEDEYQDIINEWRLVAHIMDRFLFWLFLIGSFLSSLSILVFKPMTKPNIL